MSPEVSFVIPIFNEEAILHAAVVDLVATGRLVPPVGGVHPFESARDALVALASGETSGPTTTLLDTVPSSV